MGGDVVVEPSMGYNSVDVKAQNVPLKETTTIKFRRQCAENVFHYAMKVLSFKVVHHKIYGKNEKWQLFTKP